MLILTSKTQTFCFLAGSGEAGGRGRFVPGNWLLHVLHERWCLLSDPWLFQ
jgi:hypothetical protein